MARIVKKTDPDTGEEEEISLPPLKRDSARLVQLRTGHMVSKAHLKRINRLDGDDLSCDFCSSGEKQDHDHLLLRCGAWHEQ